MPRILPGSPGLLFEFGASTRVPPRAWFELLVDPERDRVLWILGPEGDDADSRTMPSP
jgi:hypothetical protein